MLNRQRVCANIKIFNKGRKYEFAYVFRTLIVDLVWFEYLFSILAQDILLVSRLNNIYQYQDRYDKVESGLAHGCYLMFKKI